SGVPKKEIARRLGISRNTVKDYIRKVESHALSPPELLDVNGNYSWTYPNILYPK
ncbi:MAG: helix-turn-helix domain-containing protein, partial [Deltaproteobacteria bacterium]|nr:helix-turn-helix domain-containing protein [Deltaproteobacteria bacterium]